nr:hypothetical protein [Paludifilum halophilum]
MDPFGQCFFNDFTTAGASLAGSMGVDLDHTLTSTFSLVSRVLYQLPPPSIDDAFRQVMILYHSLHVQIFKRNQIGSLHQLMTDPMRVILR